MTDELEARMIAVDIPRDVWEAVGVEFHRIHLDYGPNLGRLNDNDFEVVSLRLARATLLATERAMGGNVRELYDASEANRRHTA